MRGEGSRYIDQLFVASLIIQLLVLGIDCQHGAGGHRICLFQNGIVIIVQDGIAIGIQLLDPVFQIQPDTAGYPDRDLKDR